MPRNTWRIHDTTDVRNLVKQLNPILEQLTIQLQRIEGLDSYTTELFGDVEHTGDKLGYYSATPVVQADAITDSAGSSAQNQAAINAILTVLRNLGLIASA